jgi:malate dehydrogenase
MNTPIKIAVSGAAGQISYSLIFRLAVGDLLGPDQPIHLSLLEVPEMVDALRGIAMELQDCASPVVGEVTCSSNPEVAFKDADLIFLVGARPRGPGMERKDLLQTNAGIFSVQGRAINAVSKRDVKVLVVGNPVNTNALIAYSNAPDLRRENFMAMSRLDHNRAVSLVADRVGVRVDSVKRMIVWGNHSITQFPDISHASVCGQPVLDLVDDGWYKGELITTVQNRGAEVIKLRGKSSAASAANAAINHMQDWVYGTPKDSWSSKIVLSDGSYGVQAGIMFSFPVKTTINGWEIVQGLELTDFSRSMIQASETEVLCERDLIRHLLVQ